MFLNFPSGCSQFTHSGYF